MTLPTAEIVCLGNELLIGVTINTNAAFIGEHLTRLGYEVRRITSIRDDLELALEFFKELFQRKPDVIIVTGGLGPTYDDIQLEVISKATGLELIEDKEALEQIKRYYGKKGYELTPERRKMALIPKTARILDNSVGGAPGCHITYHGMEIFCLPGVPTEMKDIFVRHVVPYLSKKNSIRLAETKFVVLNCIESQIAPYINEVKKNYPELYIKSHPAYKDKIGIVIHISGTGINAEERVEQAKKRLQELFLANIHSIEIKRLEE